MTSRVLLLYGRHASNSPSFKPTGALEEDGIGLVLCMIFPQIILWAPQALYK